MFMITICQPHVQMNAYRKDKRERQIQRQKEKDGDGPYALLHSGRRTVGGQELPDREDPFGEEDEPPDAEGPPRRGEERGVEGGDCCLFVCGCGEWGMVGPVVLG